jgi:hypothetical protein
VAIERLWNDPEFEAKHRALAKTEATRWDGESFAEQYQRIFERVAGGREEGGCMNDEA